MTGGRLYDHPEYYDIAFSWDLTWEIDFFEKLFRRHVSHEVKTILEPACGSGRFLGELAQRGYRVKGYDINPTMVAYARKRIREAGIETHADVLEGDMRSACFEDRFDAAINSINSIGYLITDDEVLSHFRATGDSLKPCGIYIVHLACAWGRLPPPHTEGWTLERDGISVKTTWNIDRQDRGRKRSHQACRLEIDDHGRHMVLEERHTLRLWFLDDLRQLVEASGRFRLEAIYDEKGDGVPLNARITGESGNHYYVLKAL